jgi:hypothetical protein
MLSFLERLPRMIVWLLRSVLVMVLTLLVQHIAPASLVAVTLYKLHLLLLAGWGGYWLDRGLFPYARPHELMAGELEVEPPEPEPSDGPVQGLSSAYLQVSTGTWYEASMLRRAIIVAACLVCVALGA